MSKKLNEVQLGILAARTAISKKSTWTRNVVARSAAGNYVQPLDKDACAWCALGALDAFVPKKLQTRVYRSLIEAADHLYPNKGHAVAHINDVKGHKAILKVFDTAFQLAGD